MVATWVIIFLVPWDTQTDDIVLIAPSPSAMRKLLAESGGEVLGRGSRLRGYEERWLPAIPVWACSRSF